MKVVHALSTAVGLLAGVATTNAAIVTTPAEIDAFYDKTDTNCTGVSVFVRIFATCGTEKTEDEAVCNPTDASKTMFCVPNRAEYLGEANPYVVVESYDDANCTTLGWCSNAFLADGKCHEYEFNEGDAQLTTVDEDGAVTIYDSCNTSATPHRQQPAASFDTGECIVDADGETSAKYYSVGQLKPTTSASATGDESGSTSKSDTPSTSTAAPVTTSTGSTSSATPAPILCSTAMLLVTTALSVVAVV